MVTGGFSIGPKVPRHYVTSHSLRQAYRSGVPAKGYPSRHRWWSWVGFAVAELVVLAITLGPLIGQAWWRGMRNVFPLDPLSYAAIATNVTQGHWALTEPFTLTGVSHYPSGWYLLIGAIAKVTTLPVWVVWTVLGIAVVSAGVLTVGRTALKISGRWWAPMLPAAALLTGVFATFVADNWYAPLGAHAVLWGPFVSLYVLNAEAAGISTAVIALSLLVLSAHDSSRTNPRRNIMVAALLIGLLANLHTYSFFTATTLAALFIATRHLLTKRNRRTTALTIALPVLVIAYGHLIANAVGPLPLFVLLIASLAPALIPAAREHLTTAVAAAIAFGLAASPQVVWTALGLASEDPFLLYRQESTRGLGVLHASTLAAAIIWVLVIATIATGLRAEQQPTLAALTIAVATAWVILPLNDVWGFNQEPYRFWLQLSMIGGMLLTIPLGWTLANRRAFNPRRRTLVTSLAAVTAVLWIVGLADVRSFAAYASTQGVIDLQTPRAEAIGELAATHDGLLMTSQCLSPRELKLITKGPVAEYNLGLAWPANEPAFRIFDDVERRAGEDPVALQAAKVQYVITDSACATDWQFPNDQRVVPAVMRNYVQDGVERTLTLWRVNPA